MTLIERSGGVNGLVHELSINRTLVSSKRGALMPSFIAGIIIFIESSITSLVAGAIGRPFCDKYGISRAKLAFVCDSTSAPVCSIIAINGWGALLLGLIGGQIAAGLIAGEEAQWLISAIGYNFYAYIALIVTFVAIWYNIDIGPMRHAVINEPSLECEDEKGAVGLFMWPMVWMIGGVLMFMLITGDGNLLKGSGSSSIFYTLIMTLLLMYGYYRFKKAMDTKIFLQASLAAEQNQWHRLPRSSSLRLLSEG